MSCREIRVANFPIPRNISFHQWASVVTEELSQYNIATPGSEDAWASWALSVFEINDLAAEGLPDPHGFDNWQTWAARLTDTVN